MANWDEEIHSPPCILYAFTACNCSSTGYSSSPHSGLLMMFYSLVWDRPTHGIGCWTDSPDHFRCCHGSHGLRAEAKPRSLPGQSLLDVILDRLPSQQVRNDIFIREQAALAGVHRLRGWRPRTLHHFHACTRLCAKLWQGQRERCPWLCLDAWISSEVSKKLPFRPRSGRFSFPELVPSNSVLLASFASLRVAIVLESIFSLSRLC